MAFPMPRQYSKHKLTGNHMVEEEEEEEEEEKTPKAWLKWENDEKTTTPKAKLE